MIQRIVGEENVDGTLIWGGGGWLRGCGRMSTEWSFGFLIDCSHGLRNVIRNAPR